MFGLSECVYPMGFNVVFGSQGLFYVPVISYDTGCIVHALLERVYLTGHQ